jgi:hypothetical protein
MDVITPASQRDAQFCCHPDCYCTEGISLKLIKDDLTIFQGEAQLINTESKFGWKYDSKEYYFETSFHEIQEIGRLALYWITCKSEGISTQKRLLSAKFTSQPFLIINLSKVQDERCSL